MTIAMPQPAIDEWNWPFWDFCNSNKLCIQRCRGSGKTWFPPSPISPFEPKAGWDWVECSGRAEVLSWVVFRHTYFAGFADRMPYNVAVVHLDEGAQMCTNILVPNDAIRIGLRVKVTFERRGAVNVPVFVPIEV